MQILTKRCLVVYILNYIHLKISVLVLAVGFSSIKMYRINSNWVSLLKYKLKKNLMDVLLNFE
jgi:hypothetical protein